MTSTKKYCTCDSPEHVLSESVFYTSWCRNCGLPTFAHLFHKAIAPFSVEARMRYQENPIEMKWTALGLQMYRTVCDETGDIAVWAVETDFSDEEKDELLTDKLRMDFQHEMSSL